MTFHEAHQAITADYLHTLADMIAKGSITAFDLSWNLDAIKPQGRLLMSSDTFVASTEAEFLRKVEEYRMRKATEHGAISVADITEDLKDHKPCPPDVRDDCALCNTKLS